MYQPTTVKVELHKASGMATMIELGVSVHRELTGKENVVLGAAIHGLSRKEIEDIYQRVVKFSELDEFMDTPVKNYSSGMHARLGFALAVNLNPDVLLVDEILAVGDEPFQHKCMDQIDRFQAKSKTIIFVSHSAEAVKEVCDRACVLDHGSLAFLGKADEAIQHYHKMLAL